MSLASAREFDEQVRSMVTPFADHGTLHLRAIGIVTWGKPKV